jgi:transcriptional regulator with XRE-family HTH domain
MGRGVNGKRTRVRRRVAVSFGGAIRKLRVRQGVTQETMARRVGLTRTSLVNIECGRQNVYLGDLFTFASQLRTTPKRLIGMVSRGDA